MNLRLPNITDGTEVEQLEQLKSYLFRLVGDLNYALGQVSTASSFSATEEKTSTASSSDEAPNNWNQLKSLIIKSADIVNAYYEVIDRRLVGKYVAESEFGIYSEETAQQIKENSTSIENAFTNLQSIINRLEATEADLINVNAHIKTGLIYYDEDGVPIYGVEIGQTNTVGDDEVFKKFTRITANKMSFLDRDGNEVAFISDYRLIITHVEINGSFREGKLTDEISEDEIITYWEGD